MTLRRGETLNAAAWAARVVNGLWEIGQRPIIGGKPAENESEALAFITTDYATTVARNVPIWRRLGIV